MTRPTLTLLLITGNAGATLARCLESGRFADEIVVLDCGSTDDTLAIAKAAGARISTTPDFPGYAAQKQRALELAGCDWVMAIDGDEWIEPPLAREILATIENPGAHAAFHIPRWSSFCGRRLRHGDWGADSVIRLYRRAGSRYSGDRVHDRIIVEGPIGWLKNPLMHEAIVELHQALEKMNRYSSLTADERFLRGERTSLASAMVHGFWTFFRSFILRAGFLDGAPGFYQALTAGEGSFYRYAKLREMNRTRPRP
jgi:glycosyltransferase involved in cell wall biosynthesis